MFVRKIRDSCCHLVFVSSENMKRRKDSPWRLSFPRHILEMKEEEEEEEKKTKDLLHFVLHVFLLVQLRCNGHKRSAKILLS